MRYLGPRLSPLLAASALVACGDGRTEPVTTEASLEATERHDYFSGEETLGGVMDELEEKPGGPDGGER